MSTIAFILERRILKAIRARAGSRYSLPARASSPRAYITRPGRFIGSLLASGVSGNLPPVFEDSDA